jgi:hypothetical protein
LISDDASRTAFSISSSAHGNNSLEGENTTDPVEVDSVSDAREVMRELQRMADRVCVLILSSDLPAIDIEIEKAKVRERCLELYPDREQLYEMVYESHFNGFGSSFEGRVLKFED